MGLFSFLFGGRRDNENRTWNRNLQSEFDANRTRQDQHYSNVNTILNQERTRQEEQYRDLRDRFMGELDNPNSPWAQIFETGGLDPEQVSRVRGISNDARNWARNPINAEDRSDLFADGTYDEFNRTGGWSDSDKANFRARSNSSIPAFYDTLRSELDTRNAASGGWNPGFSSGIAKLAREKARGARDAATDTEMQLSDSIRSGRQWGASNLTNAQQILQNIMANAKSQGLGLAGNLESNLLNQGQQGRLAGASGLAADRNAAWNGLSNLYGNTPAWYQLLGMSGDAVNSSGSSNLNYASTGLGNNPVGPSLASQLAGLGGAAAGIMTGIQGGRASTGQSGGGGGVNWRVN